MKKSISIMISLMLLLLLAIPALAQTDASMEAAARAYVPADAVLTETEMDDGLMELTFYANQNTHKYEVKLEPATGMVVKVSFDNKAGVGAATASLTEAQVIEKVKALFPEANVLSQFPETDDGLQEIEAFFTTATMYGSVEMNAATGEILEYEIAMDGTPEDGRLDEASARDALQKQMPGIEIVKIKLDEDDGRYEWEGEAILNGVRYEFELDAANGALIDFHIDD